MKPETFDEWISKRTCTSCAIYKPDTFCFMLGWSQPPEDEQPDVVRFYLVHRLTNHNTDGKPQDYGTKFTTDSNRRICVNPNSEELIIAAASGNIFHHLGATGKSERMLTREMDQITSPIGVKFIGEHFYVAGDTRAVLRRDGIDQWTNLTHEIQEESLSAKETSGFGFKDIDGFSESDIYAVGGEGDVWHYNGKKWAMMDVPTNKYLYSICCASDGNVYIGGVGHLIIRGRGDTWEIIHNEASNDRFEQIVEYQGRLLAVNEWGNAIFEITSKGIGEMDTGDFYLPGGSCLCLATGHGMLLAAGRETASLFDGCKWRYLFHPGGGDDDELLYAILNETCRKIEALAKEIEKL